MEVWIQMDINWKLNYGECIFTYSHYKILILKGKGMGGDVSWRLKCSCCGCPPGATLHLPPAPHQEAGPTGPHTLVLWLPPGAAHGQWQQEPERGRGGALWLLAGGLQSVVVVLVPVAKSAGLTGRARPPSPPWPCEASGDKPSPPLACSVSLCLIGFP